MKIKSLMLLLVVLGMLLLALPVSAQTAHSCGSVNGLAVVFDRVDAGGYAPRAQGGTNAVFDCIVNRDPNFISQRFPSAWQAFNYWLTLYGLELGVVPLPLPAPSR